MIKKWSVWPVAAQLECEKKIKTVEESTSAEGCGFPPAAFSRPASACRYDGLTRGVFLSLERSHRI